VDARAELREIAVEARMLLERERRRGRKRLTLTSTGPAAGTVMEELEGASKPACSDSRPGAKEDAAPGLNSRSGFDASSGSSVQASVEVLALPGFEPPPAASAPAIPSARLALRGDLPQDLSALAALVSTCRQCGLCETRTQTVFADGSPTAKLLFIGEAPGRDEDAQGLPFVGRAGQLLNKMIAAIDLRREDVYIGNVLKCRPPENRTPLPEEVERCLPYLEQQIALVRPALICALGLSAAQALLGTKASMTSMRGRTYEFRGVPLIPTYHPAALLRNPGLKREAWVDLQRVRDLLRAGAAT
jgi:uracil-DNA glycosylase family 4